MLREHHQALRHAWIVTALDRTWTHVCTQSTQTMLRQHRPDDAPAAAPGELCQPRPARSASVARRALPASPGWLGLFVLVAHPEALASTH